MQNSWKEHYGVVKEDNSLESLPKDILKHIPANLSYEDGCLWWEAYQYMSSCITDLQIYAKRLDKRSTYMRAMYAYASLMKLLDNPKLKIFWDYYHTQSAYLREYKNYEI